MTYYPLALLMWNIVVMLVYGLDKLLAKTHSRRISERALLLCAFFLGGLGAILGMVLFNHKTSKIKFRVFVPVAVVVFVVVLSFYGGNLMFVPY